VTAPAPVLFPSLAVGDQLPELAVEVTPTTVVLGALASRDWRPMHHDHAFATERNGVADIFLNTPNQAAWFERYVTDWAGPRARLGRMTFRMRTSVFPGDTMTFRGEVTDLSTDDVGQGWAELALTLTAVATDGRDPSPRLATTCTVRVALPADPADNPWARSGDRWVP
jgi:acyl dehydratase